MDWIALTQAQSEEIDQAPPPQAGPPSAAITSAQPTTTDTNTNTPANPAPRDRQVPPQPFLLPFLKCLVLDLQSSERTPEDSRDKAIKMMQSRKECGAPLERFSCKFKKEDPPEEFIRPALCLSCIENKSKGGNGNAHGHGAGAGGHTHGS
jgi:hypothetical protein